MTEQTNMHMSQHFYRASAADFMKIPGSPVAYWVSNQLRNCFINLPLIGDGASAVCGMTTGENARFVREWFEISINKFSPNMKSQEQAAASNFRWFPYAKGGQFRKWYGNAECVVDWENNGNRIISSGRASPRARHHYFKPSVSWSFISSSHFGARQQPPGFIFDMAGCSLFPKDEAELLFYTALMCAKTAAVFLKTINPTLNYQVNNVSSIPVPRKEDYDVIVENAQLCVELAKKDWDFYEISWDFQRNPLIERPTESHLLKELHKSFLIENQDDIKAIKEAEELNNALLIMNYGLSGEIEPEIQLGEVTLSRNPAYRYDSDITTDALVSRLRSDDLIELLSYSIGCMMGRYSLDKPGLILASQGETIQDYLAQIPSPKFMPDDDAILPLTDQEWFTDDVTNRFREFVKVVWGEERLQENLEFVAESLCLHAIKPKKSETAMETIRRYLSTQFFADHMKTYKKRPIYWLFSSGKQKAFECLVYLHRYNEGTLSRMRTEYVTPLMGKYESQIRHIEEQQETATTAEKNKLSKALKGYQSKLNELREFDNKLKHYADRRISLDLDDGVKVNYGKFGDLLAKVKEITGKAPVTE